MVSFGPVVAATVGCKTGIITHQPSCVIRNVVIPVTHITSSVSAFSGSACKIRLVAVYLVGYKWRENEITKCVQNLFISLILQRFSRCRGSLWCRIEFWNRNVVIRLRNGILAWFWIRNGISTKIENWSNIQLPLTSMKNQPTNSKELVSGFRGRGSGETGP